MRDQFVPTQKEIKDYIEKMPHDVFVNEHGEKFVIYSNGINVFMSGDEINAMVDDKDKIAGKYVSLFNPAFSIWSASELYQLGAAIMYLNRGAKPSAFGKEIK
jgi:hypothetical protein